MTKLKYKGKKYETYAACYKDNIEIAAVRVETFVSRVKRGLSVEKALITPKMKTHVGRHGPYTVEGEVYRTLPEIADAYGLKYNTVYQRYHRGRRGDDLVPPRKRKNYTPPVVAKPPSKFEVEINGRKYKSLAECCRQHGVKYSVFKMRLKYGWTLNQALNLAPSPDRRLKENQKNFGRSRER